MPPQSTLSYSFEVVNNSIDFPHRMLENGNFSCSRPSRNKELPPTSLAKGELSILKGEAVFFGKHQSEKLSGRAQNAYLTWNSRATSLPELSENVPESKTCAILKAGEVLCLTSYPEVPLKA